MGWGDFLPIPAAALGALRQLADLRRDPRGALLGNLSERIDHPPIEATPSAVASLGASSSSGRGTLYSRRDKDPHEHGQSALNRRRAAIISRGHSAKEILVFSSYRSRFGTTKAVLILGSVYLVSQIIIGSIIHDMGSLEFLKAQTTFSRSSYVEQVKQWQERGLMENYRRHFYFDFLHPLWYALFLSAFMAAGFNRNRLSSKANWLLCLPFIAGAMDLIENCFHVRFISDVDTISSWMIMASASAANIKWVLASTSILIGIIFISRGPREQMEKKREAPQL